MGLIDDGKFYSSLDIQHFLLDHGILWNGFGKLKICDNKIIAKIKPIKEDREYELIIKVNEVDFKIYREECTIYYEETFCSELLYRDYSLDWVQYLAKKYPEKKSLIKQIIVNRKQNVKDAIKTEIKPLQDKIDQLKDKEKFEIDNLKHIEKGLDL